MNFYHILILIISTIALYLLSNSYAKTLLNHDQLLNNQTMTESYNQINNAFYNDIYENGIEVSENFDNNHNPEYYININRESQVNRNKRKVEEHLIKLYDEIVDMQIKVNDIIKEYHANLKIDIVGCNRDIVFGNEYIDNNIHAVFIKCEEIIMVKQWADLTLETYLPVDSCQKYFQMSVLRDLNNVYLDSKIFNVSNLLTDPLHLDYTRMVKNLNSIITNQFDNRYIINNYLKACRLDRYYLEKAKRNNITVETLITDYSKLRKDTIRTSYLYETVLLTDLDPYNNFYKIYKSIEGNVEVDMLEHVKINDLSFHDFLLNEEIKRSVLFSFNYSFIFPLFDPEFLIIDDIIKLILVTKTGVESVQHYEIYDYYDLQEYASIWLKVKPVKRCLDIFCIVLVPSKIVISIDGILDINYRLFNGQKFTDSPILDFKGIESEIIMFHNNIIYISEKLGIQSTELFSQTFKESNTYKNLVNASFNDLKFNNNSFIECIISMGLFFEPFEYRSFKPSKRCSNSVNLNQEKYENYLLKLN